MLTFLRLWLRVTVGVLLWVVPGLLLFLVVLLFWRAWVAEVLTQ